MTMKTSRITATEANRSFSRILRAVERGERFAITSHGREVAVLQPAGDESEKALRQRRLAEHLEEMAQREFTVIAPWTREELYRRD